MTGCSSCHHTIFKSYYIRLDITNCKQYTKIPVLLSSNYFVKFYYLQNSLNGLEIGFLFCELRKYGSQLYLLTGQRRAVLFQVQQPKGLRPHQDRRRDMRRRQHQSQICPFLWSLRSVRQSPLPHASLAHELSLRRRHTGHFLGKGTGKLVIVPTDALCRAILFRSTVCND